MKRLIIVVMLVVNLCLNLFAMDSKFEKEESFYLETGHKLYPAVKKISADLYVGKVADGFYLAMERVTEKNIDIWFKYATSQLDRFKQSKYLPSYTGSIAFQLELSSRMDGAENSFKEFPNGEMWVAYASTIHIEKPIVSSDNPFIDMFCTVSTAPGALITSHMGISRTVECAFGIENGTRTKFSDQSIHLHSFAAKVMRMLGPKVYMLTVPTPVMRNILIEKLPKDSVFLGDDQCQTLFDKTTSSLHGYRLEDLVPLKDHPPRIIKSINVTAGRGLTDKFFVTAFLLQLTILKPNKEHLVTCDCVTTPEYRWLFTGNFKVTPDILAGCLIYVLVDIAKMADVLSLID